jgi:Phytanoyl-CoA dioxygenase (PhyH)
MTTTTVPRLTPEQVEHYHREGYLLPGTKVLPDEKFSRLRNHFDQKLAELPAGERPEAMDTPHFTDTALFEWALDDSLLDIVEPLVGPDILLFSTHFICKPKGDGRRVPWHEDSHYWKKMIDPMETVTLWLAIDPSTKVNACMYVIPRTHTSGKMGYSDYENVDASKSVFPVEIIKSQRREDLAVACELQPNECSLHDGRIVHGSEPNTSDLRRCGWTLRFIPAHVRLNPEFSDRHLVYQARGRNVLNQKLADPTNSYLDVVENRKKVGMKSH